MTAAAEGGPGPADPGGGAAQEAVTGPCPECGLDWRALSGPETVPAIRAFARKYRAPLTRLIRDEDDTVLRTRPAPQTWSALEYAAHVRDMFGAYGEWVTRILAEDRPALEGPRPEERVVADGYNTQDPATVAAELAERAEALAAILEAVPDEGWDRVGIRRGEERSVALHARWAVHEGNHHLLDIGRGLRAVRSGA